jgi:YihY family inner membrane protein
VDRWQREHTWFGLPLAVAYKVFDDRALHLAALITYYGFVSLFPTLLLFLTGTGFLLDRRPALRRQLVQAVLRHFPAVGRDLTAGISGFHGNGGAVAIGVLGALYGGLGVVQAAQAAFNQVYGVPRNEQPNPLTSRLRSLGLGVLLGIGALASVGVTALTSTGGVSAALGTGLRIIGYVLAFAVNAALFTGAVLVLTARSLRLRDVLAGAVFAGLVWELLQLFGSRYMAHEVSHGTLAYGIFGIVLATIAWIYLQALVLVVATEINVVLRDRLWPRALLTPFTDDVDLTDADRRAYRMYAQGQRFKGFATVSVDFGRRDSR